MGLAVKRDYWSHADYADLFFSHRRHRSHRKKYPLTDYTDYTDIALETRI